MKIAFYSLALIGKSRIGQALSALLVLAFSHSALGWAVQVPAIEVADCLSIDPDEVCTKTVTDFGNGVSVVSYDSDISSVEQGVHLQQSIDIDAAAGGGLEPSFSLSAAASTSDKSLPIGAGAEARIRWPYIIEAPGDVTNAGARTVSFDFNYSFDTAGFIKFEIRTPYLAKAVYMSRGLSTDGTAICRNHNNATWTCPDTHFEGSGTLSILAPLNQEFYIDAFGRAGPGNTDWIDSNSISMQTAFDPFGYLVLDADDPDAAKLNLSTVVGLNDATLVSPLRGAALNYVPVPPAVLLFGSGLIGLIGIGWRKIQ